MRNFDRIKAAQLEDAKGRRFWPHLTAFLHRWGHRAKSIAAFGTAVGTLFTMGAGVWRYISNRRLPPTPPILKDGERLAPDRIAKPEAP